MREDGIKNEFKKIIKMACILVGISLIILWRVVFEEVNNSINMYIQGNDIVPFINIFIQPYRVLVGLLAIATIVIVRIQFNKNMEYNQKIQVKDYINKILVGALIIFITFLISLVSAWILYSKYYYFQQQAYIGVMFESEFKNGDSFINIAGILSNGYIFIFIWYLFLTIVRYCADNAKTSMYIGCCIGLSVPHILLAIQTYINIIIGHNGKIKILSYYTNLVDGLIVPIQRGFKMYKDEVWWSGDKLRGDYYIQIVIMICIILLLINIGIMMAERYDSGLGRSILSNKYIEYVFKGYIILCIGLLPLNFMSIFLREVNLNIYIISIVTIIFILIGKFIVSQMNWEKRESVDNDVSIEHKSKRGIIIPLTMVILVGITQVDNIDSTYHIKYGVMRSVEEEKIFKPKFSNTLKLENFKTQLNGWYDSILLKYEEEEGKAGIKLSFCSKLGTNIRDKQYIDGLKEEEFRFLQRNTKYALRRDIIDIMNSLLENEQKEIRKIYTDAKVTVDICLLDYSEAYFNIHIGFNDYVIQPVFNTTYSNFKPRGYEIEGISTYTKVEEQDTSRKEFKVNKIDYEELFVRHDKFAEDLRMVDEGPASTVMVEVALLEEDDEVIGGSIFIEERLDTKINPSKHKMVLQGHQEELILKIGDMLKIEGLKDKVVNEMTKVQHKSLVPCIIKDDEYEVRIMYGTSGYPSKKHNMRIDIFRNEN